METRLIIDRGPRETVPLLLDYLAERSPHKAERVADIFSEVLKELRQNDVTDPEMVAWLVEALIEGFTQTAEEGFSFGLRDGVYCFWPEETRRREA